MSARMVASRYVLPGFEMLIDNPDLEMGRVWNLWFNLSLTDDPEAWDDEIIFVNAMQSKLGELSMDHRLIRAQMAEFCRVNPLFPNSIDILCEEIGAGRFSSSVHLGCEGRGLLNALGYHTPQSLIQERQDTLTGYARSLRKWLVQGRPESLSESKVFGFLGQLTGPKVRLVEKLFASIDSNVASIVSLKKLSEDMCRETQGESIFEGAGRPLGCVKCEACSGGESGPMCPCCYGLLIDAVLLCVGAIDEGRSGDEEQSVLGEFNRFIQECTLVYCLAINSWLSGAQGEERSVDIERSVDEERSGAEPVTSLTAMRYIAGDISRQLALRVHASLGERNDVKEWLTACLLKTVKDNQRWHKEVELIDSFPPATSWLRER